MDTKGPINPPSNQNSYIHVIVDAFSHFVVTVPIKQNNAQHAVNSLLHHWITKFGPPVYLETVRGLEYNNSDFANRCTTMGIRHSPRTPYAPWTNGLVENQNRNLGTHLRLFLHNTPENWSTQVHMYAYAHNSQPLSELNLSPYEIVFHTIPRIPINFELNLQRNTYRNCTSQYCQELPLHTHYDKSNLNPFFHKILSKPIPQRILITETAMMQIYHTVYENTKKINSMAYFNKTYHNPRPLDIGTFVLKRNFLHVHFSEKLKPLRIGPFKIINKVSDITYEIVNQDGYTSHIHRNHLVPYYPKEPIIFPFLQQYNPHSFHSKYNNSDLNDPILSFDFLSDEEQSIDDDQFSYSNSNKETEIPSSNDFQSEPFSQYSSFPYKQNTLKTNNNTSEDHTDIHDNDNFINPRRHSQSRYNFRPQPRKDYRLFL